MSYTQLGLFTGLYGLLAMLLSVPAGVSARRFGEKRVLGIGLLGVAAGSVLLGEAWSFESAIAFRGLTIFGYRFAFVSVLIAVALTAPAIAARPHDGRARRDIGARVGRRRSARRHARRRVRLASRHPRLRRDGGARRDRVLAVLPADVRRDAERRRRADGARRRQPERLPLAGGLDARADRRARRLRPVHRDLLRPERGEGVVRPRRGGGRSHHQHRLPHRHRGEPRRWPAGRSLQQARRARSRVRPAGRRVRVDGHREPADVPRGDGHGDRLRLHRGESAVRPGRQR